MNILKQVEIRFTCHSCQRGAEQSFYMPARGGGEDVIEFMERLKLALGSYHQRTSPRCLATKCDVKIPIDDETRKVGFITGGTA
jgi:hypothetical protein